MRVAIQTMGSRGDVQPYLALAVGLLQRGHRVQLVAPEQFAPLAARAGIPFVGLSPGFLALVDTGEGKAVLGGHSRLKAGLALLRRARPMLQRLWEEQWAAARAFVPDLVVYHPKALAALPIAERLGVPAILAAPLPGFTPTAAFPTPVLPFASLGILNRASHRISMQGAQLLFGRMLRDWRARALGLQGRSARAGPVATLYAYSRHVVPVPPDWSDPTVLVSGYWFLPDASGWQPSRALEAFLSRGEPPVYVGFGSMPGAHPQRFATLVAHGLARAGKRGLIAKIGGAVAFEAAPPHVHVITDAPHDRLFGLVSAALHHGGAGTTAASLRAGLPTIVCPFFGDQPFWGRQVARLGAGPPPLDRKRLDPETLGEAFRATDGPGMRRRAAEIGTKLTDEDGVMAAIAFLEKHADPRYPAAP